MHRATKPIVLAVSAVFGLGLVTAAAANLHGDAVSDLAKATTLDGKARGDAISDLAQTNGRSDRTKTPATERDGQGDTVSVIARDHDATATHAAGDKIVSNHGGAVSAAAHKR